MAAQLRHPSVGQSRAEPPTAGQTWLRQVPPRTACSAPTARSSPEEPRAGWWGTHSCGGPTAAPTTGPGCPEVRPPSSSSRLPPTAAGGGVLAHRRDAEYLFSSDAAHPDTRRWATSPSVSPPVLAAPSLLRKCLRPLARSRQALSVLRLPCNRSALEGPGCTDGWM